MAGVKNSGGEMSSLLTLRPAQKQGLEESHHR